MMLLFNSSFLYMLDPFRLTHIFHSESQRKQDIHNKLTKIIISFYSAIFSVLSGALFFRRVCEGKSLSINCGARVIDILSASYGRTRQGLCGHNGNTNCHAGTSMRVARFECPQQHRCVLYAKNSAFGEPCKGTVKYLEVGLELNY